MVPVTFSTCWQFFRCSFQCPSIWPQIGEHHLTPNWWKSFRFLYIHNFHMFMGPSRRPLQSANRVSLRPLYNFSTVNISLTVIASTKCLLHACFYRFWHLPSNATIAKVVVRDLDLLFQGQIFQLSLSLTIRASAKMRDMTFIEFDIAKVVVSDLDLLFQGQISNVTIINGES